VFGAYGVLWARTRTLGYWREVVLNGEDARLGMYALDGYGIFNVRFVFFMPVFYLFLFARGLAVLWLMGGWSDCGV